MVTHEMVSLKEGLLMLMLMVMVMVMVVVAVVY